MHISEFDAKQVHKQLGILVTDRCSGVPMSPQVQIGQRMFQVAKIANGHYLAFEYIPNGLIFVGESAEGGVEVDESFSEAIKSAYLENPNGFLTWLEEQNLNQDDVFLRGGDFAPNRIAHASYEMAVCAIISAVEANTLLPQYSISAKHS